MAWEKYFMKLIIYTDGASRCNPGKASYGYTISDGEGRLVHEEGKSIGIATNNVAEYKGVLAALSWILENIKYKTQTELYADSKLVVEQLSGRYKIKSPHLKLLIEKIQTLALDLGGITYTHVPRSQNTKADNLANQALDSLR